MLSMLPSHRPLGADAGLTWSGSQRRLRTVARAAMLLCGGMAVSAPALAVLSDTIHPFASVAYSYEDNLLRLPDAPPGVDQPRSDQVRSVVAGVDLERPVGRQLFTASASASRVQFQRFDALNYNGSDLNGNWKWALGNHLEGNLGGSYSQTLAPYADFQRDERNLRTQRNSHADLAWHLHPSWRLRTRFNRDQYAYDLDSQRYLDRKEDSGEVGIDYLPSSNSAIGLVQRRLKGSYPHPLVFGPYVLDEGYVQNETKLNVRWALTPVTLVEFLGGRAHREHNLFTDRDASGANGQLQLTWNPTAKLGLVASAFRQFSPFEGATATYSLNKGVVIKPLWNASAKLQFDAQLKYVKRDFAGLTTGLSATGTDDATRTASLGMRYQVLDQLQLGLSLLHDARSSASTQVSNSYRANSVSFNATLQF